MSELKRGEMRLLMLVRQGKGSDGWTPVSSMLMPLVRELPPELVVIETLTWRDPTIGGRVMLTSAGETVLNWCG